MQKINFITHFLLKIFPRNSKLVILGDLGMPGHKNIKWWYQFEETFDVCLHAKNKSYSSRFPWDIAKILENCYFEYFGHDWFCLPKVWHYQLVANVRVYLASKKSPLCPTIFWRYCKDMQTSYFRYFGHDCLCTSKMIVLTCRQIWCLSAC